MAGFYMMEIVDNYGKEDSIVKFGYTRGDPRARAVDCFASDFDYTFKHFSILHAVQSNVSLAKNMENYLINMFKITPGVKQLDAGYEWFQVKDRDIIKGFSDKVPDLILELYQGRTFKISPCIQESIGTLAHLKRKKLGLTQEQVAQRAGLKQKAISAVENGKCVKLERARNVLSCLNLYLTVTDGDV